MMEIDHGTEKVPTSIESGIQALVDMGFPREKAIEAFTVTGNDSVELAAAYLLSDDASDDKTNDILLSLKEDEWEDIEESYKMVFVVNTDLNMSMGKTAAQVAHGCLGLYRDIEQGIFPDAKEGLQTWTDEGQKKIVLKGKNTTQLKELREKAKNLNVPSHLIQDAGHTEVAPGSVTVLALFGLEENVNKITGSLRLLK